MVYKIIYTEEAEKYLDAIYQFLHTAYKSEKTARNTIGMIAGAIDKWTRFQQVDLVIDLIHATRQFIRVRIK